MLQITRSEDKMGNTHWDELPIIGCQIGFTIFHIDVFSIHGYLQNLLVDKEHCK